MPTSIVPWLAAIFLVMFPPPMTRKLAILPVRRAVTAFNAASSSTLTRQSSAEKANRILVQTRFFEDLTPEMSTDFARLPANQFLHQTCPELATQISSKIGKLIQKDDTGGMTKITNDAMYFWHEEMRWSKMETGLGELRKQQEETEQKQAETEKRLGGIEQNLGEIEQNLGEIEQKLDGMEQKLDGMEQKQGEMEEKLGGIEQNLGEIEQKLDGMEQTQGEMGKKLGEMEQKLDGMEQKLDGMEQKLDGMEQKLDGMEQKLDGMDQKLGGMEQKLGEIGESTAWMRGMTKNQMLELPNLLGELFEREDTLNKGQIYSALALLRELVYSRSEEFHRGRPKTFAPLLEYKTKAARNKVAHSLQLRSCLRIVDEDPAMETGFEIVFGLPAVDAKAYQQFDKLYKFCVKAILEAHARLFNSLLADTFILPYRQWLVEMRKLPLPSQQNLPEINCDLISSLETLARKVLDSAGADLAAAEARKLTFRHKVQSEIHRKKAKGETGLDQWDRMVLDLKEKGHYQKLVGTRS